MRPEILFTGKLIPNACARDKRKMTAVVTDIFWEIKINFYNILLDDSHLIHINVICNRQILMTAWKIKLFLVNRRMNCFIFNHVIRSIPSKNHHITQTLLYHAFYLSLTRFLRNRPSQEEHCSTLIQVYTVGYRLYINCADHFRISLLSVCLVSRLTYKV